MKEASEPEFWHKAAGWDSTLAMPSRLAPLLQARRILPRPYSRPALFKHMAEGRTILVNDLKIRVNASMRQDLPREESLAGMIARAFSHQDKARVQRGPAKKRSLMPVAELLDRWRGGRGIISTTDLHFRRTPAEHHIDLTPVSHFNLLLQFGDNVSFVEMMTLVISTAGNVTDSHTDDCDGSNHCFTGRKLWLVWDRLEGQKFGLQDCSHDEVTDTAAFDMETFLRLQSSRWFTVSAGETLFLPGQLAHKVVTLEPYLGFGSFYLAFPCLFLSFKRWLLDEPSNISPDMLHQIGERVTEWRKSSSRESRKLWQTAGGEFFDAARQHWQATETKATQKQLRQNPLFAPLLS